MTDTVPISNKPYPVGRFAPSPSGRMHLGNITTALLSWLSVKSRGGKWILRIEDLDSQRSKLQFSRLIEDDLQWLDIEWDEGGLTNYGNNGPYSQSQRSPFYLEALTRLSKTGRLYPCRCRRADIMATQAPHQSDGRIVYAGTCRPNTSPPFPIPDLNTPTALRLFVPDEIINFTDRLQGQRAVNLAHHCGDFVMRRADFAWAYQLAVVVDDALMGITEVARGFDLLLSTAQQIYLYRLLGYPIPQFLHLPLICNTAGQRLSKRDKSMDMSYLRQHFSAKELIGQIAYMCGLLPEAAPISPTELIPLFSLHKLPSQKYLTVPNLFDCH